MENNYYYNKNKIFILRIIFFIFFFITLFPGSLLSTEQNKQTNTDELDELEEKLSNLDIETLEAIASLFGIEYSSDEDVEDVAFLIRKEIEIDNSWVKQIIIEESQQIQVVINFGDYYITITTDYFYKKELKTSDSSFTQYIFINSEIVLDDYILQTEVLVLKKPNGVNMGLDELEIMAGGDIEVRIGNYIFYGEKIFINPITLKGILYDVEVYMPELLPFIIRAEEVKIFSEEEVIAYGVELIGTSNPVYPHYKITFEKVWLYPRLENFTINSLFGKNLFFQIGQTKLFYFPFIFQSFFSSGININLRMEESIGIYAQTTTPFKFFGTNNALILDYYQKMGLYLSLVDDLEVLPFLSIKIAGAYDRAMQFVGMNEYHTGIFSNYVDINNDNINYETFNSFRYYLELDSPIIFYKGQKLDMENYVRFYNDLSFLKTYNLVNSNNISDVFHHYIDNMLFGLDIEYMKISDPSFEMQFMEFPRLKYFLFDEDIIYQDEDILLYLPDSPGSSTTAMSLDTKLYLYTYGLRVYVLGKWKWTFKSVVGEINPYDVLNYYAIQISQVVLPDVNIMYNSMITSNLIDDITRLFVEFINPEYDFKSINEQIKDFEIVLPIRYNITYRKVTKQNYIEDDTRLKEDGEDIIIDNIGELGEDKTAERLVFSYNLPFRISYKFISIGIKIDYKLDRNMLNTAIRLDMSEEYIQIIDDRKTNYEWEWGIYSTVKLEFFEQYEYLHLYFGMDTVVEKKGYFDDIAYQLGLTNVEYGTSKTLDNADVFEISEIYFHLFCSTIAFKGLTIPIKLNSDDIERLGEIITYQNSKGEIVNIIVDEKYLLQQKQSKYYNLLFETEIINNTYIAMDYKEINRLDSQDYYVGGRDNAIEIYNYPSIFGGKGESISFNFIYNMGLEQLIFNEILIKSFKMDVLYKHYFDNNKSKRDNIILSLWLQFDIATYWQITMIYQVENKDLYRYDFFGNTNPDNDYPRNFFKDIWWAITFWNKDNLYKTFWKMKTFSISINHDLVEWDMIVTVDLRPKRVYNYIIIEPAFSLSIVFKPFPQFSGGEDRMGNIEHFIYERY